MMKDLMVASGTIDENSAKNEYVAEILNFVMDKVMTYEQCRAIWAAQRPDSELYVRLPDTIDWTLVKEGEFIPFGVPIGKYRCFENYEIMRRRLKPETLTNLDYDKDQHDFLLRLLRVGKGSCPGLIQRDHELDLFIKNALRTCLLETIRLFTKGLGKSNLLGELHKELKDLANIRY